MAQRIRHLTTNQGIPGSNPGRVVFLFILFRYSSFSILSLFSLHIYMYINTFLFNLNHYAHTPPNVHVHIHN